MDKQTNYNILPTIQKLKEYIFDKLKESYKELNLTGSQSAIIHSLHRNKRQKMSELSTALGLSNSTVSGIVDRLEKMKIVKRVRDDKDRRVVYVELSDEHDKFIKEHYVIAESAFEFLLDSISKEEQEKVLEAMAILDKILDKKSKGCDRDD